MNIKAITQLLGKPLTDINESDIDKLINSDRKDLLLDLTTVEYLMENSNDLLKSCLQPVYVQLTYSEEMDKIEKLLTNYVKDGSVESTKVDELKKKLEKEVQSDGVISVIASTLLLLTLYKDYDFSEVKENIQNSLSKLEEITCTLPLPSAMPLMTALMNNLYFPVINVWHDHKNELIVKPSEEFHAKIQEYRSILKEMEEAFISANVNLDEDESQDKSDMITCTDGKERTQDEYEEWIKNLMHLYESEEGDLTTAERQALVECGCIDNEEQEEN